MSLFSVGYVDSWYLPGDQGFGLAVKAEALEPGLLLPPQVQTGLLVSLCLHLLVMKLG